MYGNRHHNTSNKYIFGFPMCTEPIFGSEFKINDAMQPRIGMCTFWLRNRGPVLTPF